MDLPEFSWKNYIAGLIIASAIIVAAIKCATPSPTGTVESPPAASVEFDSSTTVD